MMDIAIGVYNDLKAKGYAPTLVNARFAYPMDLDCIKDLVESHKYIFTLEDNNFIWWFWRTFYNGGCKDR